MDLSYDKIRYDLALTYAKANYEILLSKGTFQQTVLPDSAGIYQELDFLMDAFGRAYRELCFTPDAGMMKKMNFTQDDFEMLDTLAADKQR